MRTRRIIHIPVIVLLSLVLVAAIIKSGQQQRLAADRAAVAWQPSQASLLLERDRLDRIERFAARCIGPIECDPRSTQQRYEAAAEQVTSAPIDHQLTRVRGAVAGLLTKRAQLAELQVRSNADGRLSASERAAAASLQKGVTTAALEAINARHDAGLLDSIGRERLRTELGADPTL